MKTIRIGFSFPFPVKVLGGFMFLIFFFFLKDLVIGITQKGMDGPLDQLLMGILMGLAICAIPFGIGVFCIFTAYGVQLDPARDRFREYGQYFFIKKGKWQKLSDRPYLSILSKDRTYKGRASGIVTVAQYNFQIHELCLLSSDHRKRTSIYSSSDKEKVEKMAKEMSSYLGKELVTFSPPRSEKTKRRMQKRR